MRDTASQNWEQDWMHHTFTFAKTPMIYFGPGEIARLPERIAGYGRNVLFVTGVGSYQSAQWDSVAASLCDAALEYWRVTVKGEPSPELVDAAVAKYGGAGIDVVVAWGGGSAIDAGKAISAMLPRQAPVLEYLEGAGAKTLADGRKIPFIAVPTTSGTGSEATKNAVLSRIGPDGFKKSLRHDNFVPDVALIDPELMLSCPPYVTAACGMDACAQLLEAYVSTEASPLTDALALSGLARVGTSLARAVTNGQEDLEARVDMAYAALLSGITLANAGLGAIHGLAAPLGGYFAIPHGVVCGVLMAPVTSATIDMLTAQGEGGRSALRKYAQAGAVLSGRDAGDTAEGCAALVETLRGWVATLGLPRLGAYGIRAADFGKIVAGAGNKNNPAPLDPGRLVEVLREAL